MRFLSKLSIEWQLPIATGVLLVAVTIALGFVAHREVANSARHAADERMAALGTRLSAMVQEQSRGIQQRAHAIAADPAVRAFLRSGTPQDRSRALAVIAPAARDSTTLSAGLRDSLGRRVLQSGPAAARTAALELPRRTREAVNADSASLGDFVALGDTIAFPVVALITDSGRRLGYLVQWRRNVSSVRARDQFAAILGTGGSLLIGSWNGAWTDQVSPVAAPPRFVLESTALTKYDREGSGPQLARAVAVAGTPWLVLLEFPEAVVLAPATRFVREVMWIGLALLAVGFVVAWLTSRSITRPLRELTAVAESVGDADYTRRTSVPGSDEVARLANAFNVMAARVEKEVAGRRASEQQWRMIFDRHPQPMWVYDLDTLVFLAVNDATVATYGFTRDEFLEMTLLDIRPPDEVERLKHSIATDVGGLVQGTAWRHRRKNGTEMDVEISSHAIEFAARPARLVQATDVTARRALEAELRQSQKMDAVGRLAGGVAHDFNNLLTVIMTYAELLRESVPPDAGNIEDIDVITQAAQQANALTRQLLAFSRQQVLRPAVVDPNAAITVLSNMLRRVIGEDINFATELDPGAGRVKVDPGQLDQVLLNLVVNSRDAMPKGGRLVIRTAAVELDEDTRTLHGLPEAGQYVSIAVTDTGTGMSAETRARIFEPFFTTKEQGKGTGLGLATVYGIVKQSGGYVAVYSEPGMGTTFRIYLPRLTAEDGAPASADRRAHPRGGSETILLVEDDAAVRTVTAQILKRQGYRVIAAQDGDDAIAQATSPGTRLDLVLTDIVMPGMDGAALLVRLRQHEPDLKVLFMSGYAGDAILRRGIIESGMPFLEKPFTITALASKVRETLDAAAV